MSKKQKKVFATFSDVTDNYIAGKYGELTLYADRLPRERHGFQIWELKWVLEGTVIHQEERKCRNAGEARAILIDSAPYYLRTGKERLTSELPQAIGFPMFGGKRVIC